MKTSADYFSDPFLESVYVPLEHTVSKIAQKILINCRDSEKENSDVNM